MILGGAFVPALLSEFNLGSLLCAIKEAVGRLALPLQSFLTAREAPSALIPISELPLRPLPSLVATGGPGLPPALDAGPGLPDLSLRGGAGWRSRPASPPQAPPRLAKA